MKLRMYALAFLAFSLSLFLLLHFIFIWQSGSVRISEPNPLLLLADTIVVLAAVVFSFYCMVKQILNFTVPRK